jgi:hypothetical protein
VLSPSFDKMRERLIRSIEFALGLPQYSRGVVGVADVATEVALADQAIRTRNGRRLQAIQSLLEWAAKATVGLYEEFLPSDSQLPIRLTGRRESLMVTRNSLAARHPGKKYTQEPMDYDYEVVPFSPTENSRVIQLKNLSQVLDLFLQSPDVDNRALLETLTDLLNLDASLLRDEKEVAAEQQAMAAAAAGGGAAPGAPPPGPEGIAGPGGVVPGAPTVPIPPLPVGGPGVG